MAARRAPCSSSGPVRAFVGTTAVAEVLLVALTEAATSSLAPRPPAKTTRRMSTRLRPRITSRWPRMTLVLAWHTVGLAHVTASTVGRPGAAAPPLSAQASGPARARKEIANAAKRYRSSKVLPLCRASGVSCRTRATELRYGHLADSPLLLGSPVAPGREPSAFGTTYKTSETLASLQPSVVLPAPRSAA